MIEERAEENDLMNWAYSCADLILPGVPKNLRSEIKERTQGPDWMRVAHRSSWSK